MLPGAIACALAGGSAAAESASASASAPPRVVTDVAPIHGLVAAVMAGVAEPDRLVAPGTSPHSASLRPSQARAMQDADLVFWVGPRLTPWLGRALETLGGDARIVRLDRVPGIVRLPVRGAVRFGASGGTASDLPVDPHLWLDPRNAMTWVARVAEALGTVDPTRRAVYEANAAALRARLETLDAEIAARLAPLAERPFVVFHDAYRYFEERYGVMARAALAPSDASPAGPARLRAVRQLLVAEGIVCVFAEPQFSDALLGTVIEGTGARAAVLDPIGIALPAGPGFYPALMTGLADAMAGCLAP